MFDLLGHPTHFQPSLGELQFNTKCLHLIEELVDLCRHGLALLVKGVEMVDFCHISPVILREHVKPSAECGERGGGSHECGEEPSQEPPGCLVSFPSVDWGVQVNDDREVIGGIPVSVAGHPSLVQVPDPPGQAVVPVMAGDLDPDLSPVLNVPIWWVGKWSLHNWGWPRCSCHLAFFQEEVLHVVEVTSSLHGEAQAVDELL
jgi:hypothetical protein